MALPNAMRAQDELVVEDGPLIDQPPFDLITLVADEGAGAFKVMLIPFPNRILPKNPKPNDSIEVVFTKFPDRRYAIQWRSIDRIDLYENMILDEAKKKLDAKDIIGAFQNLSFLMRNYPNTPQLDQLHSDFLYRSLSTSFSARQFEQTLSAIEELKQIAPQYRTETITRGLNNVVQTLLEQFEKKNDFDSIKKILERLEKAYGPIEVVKNWEARLKSLADSKLSDAEKFLHDQRYREAFMAVYASLSLIPDSERSQQLLSELARIHPVVRVGVMQQSNDLDPSSLTDWAARRAGMLVYRPVFEFLRTGNEGGDYGFALGTHQLSDDRQSLLLNLDKQFLGEGQRFWLAQLIADRADPDCSSYDPAWAAIFKSVQVAGSDQIQVGLQRPHVLPHAHMQWHSADEADKPNFLAGAYQRTGVEPNEVIYSLRPSWKQSGLPSEVVEIHYVHSTDAINDLARGYIDAIDQLYPADARRLGAYSQVRTFSYALASTHLLVPNPNSNHEFLKQEKFRRALLYATDRKGILRNELLGSEDAREGRLISGPFPYGQSETDPLSYAYDTQIEPVGYEPQLGKILVTISKQELEKAAQKLGSEPPKLRRLIVGCPNFELARIATEALIQQWAVIGIEAEMRVLDSTSPELSDQIDLLYVTTSLWEPATDIHRLLGSSGVTQSDNPFVIQGLGKLRNARNWRDVRTALHDLHRIVAYHLPILPLWQISERFVARSNVQGISDRPTSLYQNLKNWKIVPKS